MKTIMTRTRNFLTNEEGGVFAEYGLLIAVLVLGLVVVAGVFITGMQNWFTNIGNELENQAPGGGTAN